jgi:hypothetical protein
MYYQASRTQISTAEGHTATYEQKQQLDTWKKSGSEIRTLDF